MITLNIGTLVSWLLDDVEQADQAFLLVFEGHFEEVLVKVLVIIECLVLF